MPEIKEIRQLALDYETAEGTAETLTAADVIEVYEPTYTPEEQRFQRNPARSTFSHRASRSGTKSGKTPARVELRGSGTNTTDPPCFKVLRAAGCQIEPVFSEGIGTVTSGPFVHNETITGGTSGATGRVLYDTANGASAILYVPMSGTFQSAETITGGTSGASATSSGTPAGYGRLSRPKTTTDAESIGIGAVTGGPFIAGETVTGGTSSATGVVAEDCHNGAARLYLRNISGTFQSGETLTGGTSSASATSSSTMSSANGVVPPAYTCQLNTGVKRIKSKGARATAKLMFRNGEPGMIEFELSGVRVSEADGLLLTGVTPLTTVPPTFQGVALTMGSYSPIFETLEVDFGNEVQPRNSANDSSGIKSYLITQRAPTFSIDPETVTEAVNGFFTDWYADTARAIDFTLGSSAGNRFRFHAPAGQITGISEGDRGGIVTMNVTGQLNDETDSDQEWSLLSY